MSLWDELVKQNIISITKHNQIANVLGLIIRPKIHVLCLFPENFALVWPS